MAYRNDFGVDEMILDVSSYEPLQSTLVEETSGVMVAAAFDHAVLTAIRSTNDDNQYDNDHFVAILFDMTNVLQRKNEKKDLMINDDGAAVSFEMSRLALLSTPPLDGREDEERERLAAAVVVSSFGVVNRWSLSMSCESRSIIGKGKRKGREKCVNVKNRKCSEI
jgi:hypothetical protein